MPNISTDTTRANNNGFGFVPGINNSQKSIPWFGTVRGRIGLTVWPSLLVYGTGGFAYADVQRNNGGSFWAVNNNALQTGWTAGGGLEWMFMQNLSANADIEIDADLRSELSSRTCNKENPASYY